MNRGNHFEAVELPAEAQFAPPLGVCVADLDGDGNEDVFLSQNFFAMTPDERRLDAGRGLWLRGDGTGRLTPVPGQISGVKVYGEQRGFALADFDEDGRVIWWCRKTAAQRSCTIIQARNRVWSCDCTERPAIQQGWARACA